MTRSLLLSLSMALCFAWSWGAPLSSQEALQRALQSDKAFCAPARLNAYNNQPQWQLAYTDAQAVPALYIFTPAQGQGYMVVAGDDVAAPILGYCESGAFDPAAMPNNMKWWLSQYAEQITWARENGAPCYAYNSDSDNGREPIAPLVTTTWDQGIPYNNDCPEISGQKCYTGCVATSMAQIMNYHKYPEHGTGSISYAWNGQTLSADFAEFTFDWDNMCDSYLLSGSYTDAQVEAVAQLMEACGLSVEMNYGTYASSAFTNKPTSALPQYFNYDVNTFFAERLYHPLSEWIQLVYDQLANVGPVEYSGGDSDNVGHSFVCDGYASDNYFHINWGWGGYCDGYFQLDALDPEGQGIGGGSGAYVNDNSITGGIQLPGATYTRRELTASTFYLEFAPDSETFYVNYGDVLNNSYLNATGTLGLKLVNQATGETMYKATNRSLMALKFRYYINQYVETQGSESEPDGTYLVTPAWRTNDMWYPIYVNIQSPYAKGMVVNIENGIWSMGEQPEDHLTGTLTEVPESIVFGKEFEGSFSLLNEGDTQYDGFLHAILVQDDTTWSFTSSFEVSVAPGATQEYTQIFNFNSYYWSLGQPQPGTYTIYLANCADEIISNGITTELVEAQTEPDIQVYSFSLQSSDFVWEEPFWAEIEFVDYNHVGGEVDFYMALIDYEDLGDGYVSLGDIAATTQVHELSVPAYDYGVFDDDLIFNDSPTGETPAAGNYIMTFYNSENRRIAPLYYATLEVNKQPQEIIWDQVLDVNVGDSLELNAYATSGLPVSYEVVQGNDLVTVNDNLLSVLATGQGQICAMQEGDNTYDAAEPVYKEFVAVNLGISDAASDHVKVTAENLTVSIEGLSDDAVIAIYSIDGKLIYQGTDHVVTVPSRGAYLLHYLGNATKILF